MVPPSNNAVPHVLSEADAMGVTDIVAFGSLKPFPGIVLLTSKEYANYDDCVKLFASCTTRPRPAKLLCVSSFNEGDAVKYDVSHVRDGEAMSEVCPEKELSTNKILQQSELNPKYVLPFYFD